MELLAVHRARLVLVPRTEQVHHAIGGPRKRILERPQQILGHVDLARAILVEGVEPLPELLLRELALLAVAHELAELGEVELAIIVRIRRVALHRVLTHAGLEVLLAGAGGIAIDDHRIGRLLLLHLLGMVLLRGLHALLAQRLLELLIFNVP